MLKYVENRGFDGFGIHSKSLFGTAAEEDVSHIGDRLRILIDIVYKHDRVMVINMLLYILSVIM